MTRWFRLSMGFLGALGILMAGGMGVDAATITFDECPNAVCSEAPPVVSVIGFDVQVPDRNSGPEQASVGAFLPGTVPGKFTTSAPNSSFPFLVAFLLEDATTGKLSDAVQLVLQVEGGVATVSAAFLSDGASGLSSLSTFFVPGLTPALVETGDLQDLSGVFLNALTGDRVSLPSELHIVVRSEVSEVPEPGTLFLLGAGLGALGLATRRRRV